MLMGTANVVDDPEYKKAALDYRLSIWAGVVPIRMVADTPVDDPRLEGRADAPDALNDLNHLGLARR